MSNLEKNFLCHGTPTDRGPQCHSQGCLRGPVSGTATFAPQYEMRRPSPINDLKAVGLLTAKLRL